LNKPTIPGAFKAGDNVSIINNVISSPSWHSFPIADSTISIGFSQSTVGTTDTLYKICYGNGLYVAVGPYNILTSPDGITWTQRNPYSSSYAVTYGNGLYVAVGRRGGINTSPDGITWTSRTSGTMEDLNAVIYGNGLYVVVGEAGTILTSPDGITWTQQNSGASNGLNGVIYANGLYVVVSYQLILTSPDGITWTQQNPGTSNDLNGVTYGNGLFVAVGTGGTILSSPDGINWTTQTSGITSFLYEITYGNGLYVAVSYGGIILTSPDGITWTQQTSGTTSNLLGITYGNGLYVAVGESGTILKSTSVFIQQAQSDWNETDNTKPDYLKNKPTIPAAQVNADWNASSGVAQILNKPTIPASLTAGDHISITNNAISAIYRAGHKISIDGDTINYVDDNDSNFPWWAILVGAGLVAGIGLGIAKLITNSKAAAAGAGLAFSVDPNGHLYDLGDTSSATFVPTDLGTVDALPADMFVAQVGVSGSGENLGAASATLVVGISGISKDTGKFTILYSLDYGWTFTAVTEFPDDPALQYCPFVQGRVNGYSQFALPTPTGKIELSSA
jgi:hypothetical protein